jgi:hypothetical protein
VEDCCVVVVGKKLAREDEGGGVLRLLDDHGQESVEERPAKLQAS